MVRDGASKMTRIDNAGGEPHRGDIPTRKAKTSSDSARPAPAAQNLPAALQPLGAGRAGSTAPPLPRRARNTTLSDPLIETPYDKYALESIIYESRFNGSRPNERLSSQFMPSSLRGDSPFWDLDERAIARIGGNLASYGDLSGSPFEAPDGKLRIRLHYADKRNIDRMLEHYDPSGWEPAFMRNSYRTVQVKTPSGWQHFKFSMPDNPRYSFNAPHKELTPAEIQSSVRFSAALRGNAIYGREPAGIALSLDDGRPAITQLWREMSVASRGFRPGDFVAPIHVLTDPEFARTERGQAIFGPYAEGEISAEEAQASWLVSELAPKLADIVTNSLTDTYAHPQLHEQNVEAVIDANGRILDVFVKDLADIALDYRAIAVAGDVDRWRSVQVNDRAYASPIANDLQFPNGKRYAFGRHYQAFLGSIGARVSLSAEQPPRPSAVVEQTARIVSERVNHWLPEAWMQARRGTQAYEGAFGPGATAPHERIANLRELIVEYLEERNPTA